MWRSRAECINDNRHHFTARRQGIANTLARARADLALPAWGWLSLCRTFDPAGARWANLRSTTLCRPRSRRPPGAQRNHHRLGIWCGCAVVSQSASESTRLCERQLLPTDPRARDHAFATSGEGDHTRLRAAPSPRMGPIGRGDECSAWTSRAHDPARLAPTRSVVNYLLARGVVSDGVGSRSAFRARWIAYRAE